MDEASDQKHHQFNEYYNESHMLLQKLMENLKGNPALQNVYIRQIFKLEQIKSEGDLQEYKNLLNSMAALFYTNHRMSYVTHLFYLWREASAAKQEERLNQQSQKKKPMAHIQIDTELANQDAFKNYRHVNKKEDAAVRGPQQFIDDEPSEIQQNEDIRKNMMIHIEGDENTDILNDDDDDDESIGDQDAQKDRQARRFLDDLLKVGPYAKQILNYTYPPLLYQRGDGDDDDGEDEGEEEDDDAAVRDILEGGAVGGIGMPDFGIEDDDDDDIQELIKGGGANGGLNNRDLYRQIKKAV